MGMKHWGKSAVIMSAVVVVVLFCACQNTRQDSAVAVIGGADGVRRVEKDFGTYEVPDGFVEDAVYSRQQAGKWFYVSQADEKKLARSRKQFVNNISVNKGSCPYSVEEHKAFRSAILAQLMMQMDFFATRVANYEAGEVTGGGSFTDADDILYTFTSNYKIDGIAETTTQHYIVGNQKFVLVHETARGDSEETDRAALCIAESFRWAD
ncbi:MAG: hypothetical protein HDR32_06550 [Treponema sp.]|nr:hypothetical protein [Treponema sp.]